MNDQIILKEIIPNEDLSVEVEHVNEMADEIQRDDEGNGLILIMEEEVKFKEKDINYKDQTEKIYEQINKLKAKNYQILKINKSIR